MTASALRSAVHAALRQGCPEEALDLLLQILLSQDAALPIRWEAHNLLPHVAQRISGAAATDRRIEQARCCGVALPTVRRYVGRAEFPAVSPQGGCMVGTRVSASAAEDDEVYPVLAPESVDAVHAALAAARRLVPTADTQRLRVDVEQRDIPVAGRSLGLAVGIAALSYLRRIELPESAVFTGELRHDGSVVRVSHIDGKQALVRQRRPLAVLFLPADNPTDHASTLPVSSLSDVLVQARLDSERDVETDLNRVQSDYRAGRWVEAARHAQPLLTEPGLRYEEQLQLQTILLSATNHRGDLTAAAEYAAGIRRLLQHPSIPAQAAALAMASVAVHCIDLLRGEQARAVLGEAVRLPLPERDPCWIHLHGTEARACILLGDLPEALRLRLRNAETCPDDEKPRCLGDLADCYLRLEHWEQAGQTLQAAQASLTQQRTLKRRIQYLRRTQDQLLLYEARLRRARGDIAGARASLAAVARATAAPQPDLWRIESALLEDTLPARIAAISAALEDVPTRDAAIGRALALRARLFAGDLSAQPELAELLGVSALDVRELCRRVPY